MIMNHGLGVIQFSPLVCESVEVIESRKESSISLISLAKGNLFVRQRLPRLLGDCLG